MAYGDDDYSELNAFRDIEVAKHLRKNRIVFLDSDVNERLALELSKLFMFFSGSKRPVKMYINSPGGDVPSMFRIINMMEHVRFPIHTFGSGWVCSAATDIFIAGHKRLLWTNATLMSHQGTDFHYGKVEDAEASVAEQRRLHEWMIDHYVRYTALTRDEVQKCVMPEHDVYITPEEALMYGMCDKIVEPKPTRKKPRRLKALTGFLKKHRQSVKDKR